MPDDSYLTFRAPAKKNRIIQERNQTVPPTYEGPGREGRAQKYQRLGPKLTRLEAAIEQQSLRFADDAGHATAEEILVLEIAGSFEEFREIVAQVEGMECLIDEDTEFQPGKGGFKNKEERKENEPVTGLLYLIATDQAALQQLHSAWKRKQAGEPLRGIASKLGAILDRVVDIRGWNWQDRLREADMDHWRQELAEGAEFIRFEAELWYRTDSVIRRKDTDRFRSIVDESNGIILSQYEHEGTAYLGFVVEIPSNHANALLDHPESCDLFNLGSVFHFWCTGQSVALQNGGEQELADQEDMAKRLPTGEPKVALLDGLPVASHPHLRGRLEIDDPDGWEDTYLVSKRDHGTTMASLICHGDLSSSQKPLGSPVYVRPIMRGESNSAPECIPSNIRANDLLHRCIHRIKVGDDGEPAIAPSVQVINLSVGDRFRIFDGTRCSAWARMLDWLQYHYNVLIIISAGNALRFRIDSTQTAFENLDDDGKEKAIFEARFDEVRQLRLISPAETLNGITVGSSHIDNSGEVGLGVTQIIPIRHPDLPSPSSRNGPGYRGSIKPDILVEGGRQPLSFRNGEVIAYGGSLAPGLKVAAPPGEGSALSRTKFIRGTSASAALATRKAAIIIERLESLEEPAVPVEFIPVLVKSLLVHAASWHDAETRLREMFGSPGRQWSAWQSGKVLPQVGYGRLQSNSIGSDAGNVATILGWEKIQANEILEFSLPMPNCLKGKQGRKRFTVTLAWFSPINPRNRKYRVAKLSIKLPESPNEFIGKKSCQDAAPSLSGKGTVQHEVYEGTAVRGIPDENFNIQVECITDGGEISEEIRFGLAVSVEGQADVFSTIKSEITEQLKTPIPIEARVR